MTTRRRTPASVDEVGGFTFAAATPPVRADTDPGAHPHAGPRVDARPRARTRADVDPQARAQLEMARGLEVAARALTATLTRADDKRAALTELVRAARTLGMDERRIESYLLVGELPDAEIATAMHVVTRRRGSPAP